MESSAHLSFGKRLAVAVANGFGLGNARYASGTVGSLLGIPLVFAISSLHGRLWWQIGICAALVALAIVVCDIAERHYGEKDDGRIVADEWMLYPIGVIGIQLVGMPWWHMLVYFAVIRFFDIVKLPPANRLQAIDGGLGVVADDFAANLYSLAANWALYWFWLKGFGA